MSRPLIVTLALDAQAQSWFEGERKRYFPTRLNRIPAHISLFHALPGEEIAAISTRLRELASIHGSFFIEVHDLQRLGRGVAYALRSEELQRLHTQLRGAWLEWLTPQDRQPFRPHIVIQNKVDPQAARALYDQLAGGFRPWPVQATGLLLWHYEGGPWTRADAFAFTGEIAV